jgi:penicillin-binding protein 2
MPQDYKNSSRAAVILIFWMVALSAMLIRTAQLQIIEGNKYKNYARQNRVRKVTIPAARGLIYSRDSVIIAESRPSFSLVLVAVRDWGPSVIRAAGLLGLDSNSVKQVINNQRRAYPKDPVAIVRNLSPEQVALIEEHTDKLPGLRLVTESRRKTPFESFASHLIGYTSEINSGEFERLKDQGYQLGDFLGKGGLEKQYEKLLRGSEGCEFVEVDAKGREQGNIPDLDRLEPDPGVNLYLTIDWKLQQLAESLFTEDMLGSAVALEPSTGRILALVSRPNFDPNLFATGISAAEWNRLINDPTFPLWDRAIRSAYPPGSTFKVFTAAAALDSGLIDPEGRLPKACHGSIRIGNRVFKCWKAGGHGSLNLRDAIVHSCDVYFYQLGQMLGVKGMSDLCLEAGLGEKTGLDLPQEVGGLVPTIGWYEKRLGRGSWGGGVPANMAIGQGELLVTPLQMAVMYGAIGNNGVLYRPHLVMKAETYRGEVLFTEKLEKKQLPISERSIALLKEALAGVVNQPGGTGGAARVLGVEVAGKTGTAQNPHGDDHSWFVAFAPKDDPQIAVAVIVENAGHGSAVAAPLAGRMIRQYLTEKGLIGDNKAVMAAVP